MLIHITQYQLDDTLLKNEAGRRFLVSIISFERNRLLNLGCYPDIILNWLVVLVMPIP